MGVGATVVPCVFHDSKFSFIYLFFAAPGKKLGQIEFDLFFCVSVPMKFNTTTKKLNEDTTSFIYLYNKYDP